MTQYNKLFIIGSTSFAASYLINLALSKGIQVVGVSRSSEYEDIFLPYAKAKNRGDYQFHQIDIREDLESLVSLIKKEKPNLIVDFAGQGMVAPSWIWPEQWYETNVVSKSSLINRLLDCDFLDMYVKISTPEVYGSVSGVIDETAHYNPTTPYAISHAAIDMHLNAYFKQHGFPVITTRFANFYGPCQQLYRLGPKVFYSALLSEVFNLEGGGTSVRAFIHGDDVADAILRVATSGKLGQAYHFTTDEFVSIRDFVDMALKICGKKFDDIVQIGEDRLGKDAAYLMSSEKALVELNWQPKISLKSGLTSVHHWMRDNIELIKNHPLTYIHKR
jgi:dTDP-glucose 4,6-dehydratase